MNKQSTFKVCIALLLCTVFFNNCIQAQINPKIYMKLIDLEKMKRRKLLVELIEPDEDQLKKLEKKRKKEPENYDRYMSMISDYNQFVQSAVKKYWRLNKEYEFVTTSQLDKMIILKGNKKSNDYAVLRLAELSDMDYVFERKSDIGVMVLNYGRSEQLKNKPDYHIYIPKTKLRDFAMWTESEIELAVLMLHNNIDYIEDKKKVVNFDGFQEASVIENCEKLNGGTVLIDSMLIGVKDLKDILDDLDVDPKFKVQLTNNSTIQDALNKKEENTYILVCVPYGIMKPQSVIPGISVSILITGKLLIHCKDAQIYNSHEWIKSGMEMGFKKIKAVVQKRNIEGVLKCDKKKLDKKLKEKN